MALTVVGHVQALGLHLGRNAEQAQPLQDLRGVVMAECVGHVCGSLGEKEGGNKCKAGGEGRSARGARRCAVQRCLSTRRCFPKQPQGRRSALPPDPSSARLSLALPAKQAAQRTMKKGTMRARVQAATTMMHTTWAASTEPSPPMIKPYLRCSSGERWEGGEQRGWVGEQLGELRRAAGRGRCWAPGAARWVPTPGAQLAPPAAPPPHPHPRVPGRRWCRAGGQTRC